MHFLRPSWATSPTGRTCRWRLWQPRWPLRSRRRCSLWECATLRSFLKESRPRESELRESRHEPGRWFALAPAELASDALAGFGQDGIQKRRLALAEAESLLRYWIGRDLDLPHAGGAPRHAAASRPPAA